MFSKRGLRNNFTTPQEIVKYPLSFIAVFKLGTLSILQMSMKLCISSYIWELQGVCIFPNTVRALHRTQIA